MFSVTRKTSYLIVFFLAVTAATPMAIGASSEETLKFILAEQASRLSNPIDLSYSVSTSGTTLDVSNGTYSPVDSNTDVIRTKQGILYTREHLVIGHVENATTNRQEMRAEKFLATDAVIVKWPDVVRPEAYVYIKEEWKSPVAVKSINSVLLNALPLDPLRLSYLIDDEATLAGAVESINGSNIWEFAVETEHSQSGEPSQFIVSRVRSGETRPDLTIWIDPQKDFVISRTVFEPYRQDDSYRREYKKEFAQVGGRWIVSRFDLNAKSERYSGPVDDIETRFELEPLGSEQQPELSLASLQLPSLMVATKIHPPVTEGDATTSVMELRDGQLFAVDSLGRTLTQIGIIEQR